jgi:predicted phage baseplate assembly protein
MLSYYLDAQAGETFLATARRRESVIALTRLIGYRMKGPVAATTSLRFALPAALKKPITIPAGTAGRARLDDEVADFETAETVTIDAGLVRVDIPARQGIRRTETFTATGTPNQKFDLSSQAIAEGTIVVEIAGAQWSFAEHFQDSGPASPHFLAETDHLNMTRLVFGDGRAGMIPAASQAISISYLETLGAAGNLGAGLITQLLTPVYLDGVAVPLSVTNPIPATGGTDRETIDHARKQAPAELAALWKAVTRSDLETLAEGFPGIAKARAIDPEDCPHLPYLQVLLAVAPQGGGLASPLLKEELAAFIDKRRVATVEIHLLGPVYHPIDIDARIWLLPGEEPAPVELRIRQALADYLAFDHVDFGQDIYVSDLVALIDGARGVSHLTLLSPSSDVLLRSGEIPALGNVYLDLRRA